MPTSAKLGVDPKDDDWIRKIPPLYVLGVVALVPLAVVLFAAIRPGTEEQLLNRSDYEQAVARWQSQAPKSYDMRLFFYSHHAPVDLEIEVRDGQATKLVRNGVLTAQAKLRESWTVDVLLQKIGEDLITMEDPDRSFDVKKDVVVRLHARFDETHGYPAAYRREAHGSPIEFHWQVKSFSPRSE
jgi:hypothetical protein